LAKILMKNRRPSLPCASLQNEGGTHWIDHCLDHSCCPGQPGGQLARAQCLAWFFISVIFSPLVGFTLVLVLPKHGLAALPKDEAGAHHRQHPCALPGLPGTGAPGRTQMQALRYRAGAAVMCRG
jgi:hypothetical protein